MAAGVTGSRLLHCDTTRSSPRGKSAPSSSRFVKVMNHVTKMTPIQAKKPLQFPPDDGVNMAEHTIIHRGSRIPVSSPKSPIIFITCVIRSRPSDSWRPGQNKRPPWWHANADVRLRDPHISPLEITIDGCCSRISSRWMWERKRVQEVPPMYADESAGRWHFQALPPAVSFGNRRSAVHPNRRVFFQESKKSAT